MLEVRIWESNANVAADVKGEADMLTLVESVEQKEKGTKHRTLGESEQAPEEMWNKQSARWEEETEVGCGKGPCYERQDGLHLKSSSEVKCRGKVEDLETPWNDWAGSGIAVAWCEHRR